MWSNILFFFPLSQTVWSETELIFVPPETYFKFRSLIGQKKRQGKRKHNEHPQNDPAVQQLWRQDEDQDEELHCYKWEKLKQHDTTKRANQRFKKQNQAATSVGTNHHR